MIENEKQEKELYKYIYVNNSKDREVVFECEAEDILEADKKYTAATGHDPRKQNNIGCSILNKDGSPVWRKKDNNS